MSTNFWLTLLLCSACCTGQDVLDPAKQPTMLRATTTEVLLDLVVRDKREHLVRNLTQQEIEVYEDGVKQQIRVFRAVSGKQEEASSEVAARSSQTAGTSESINTLRELNLVSIVFEQMGYKGRKYAADAALNFLKREMTPNTFAAVFSLDSRLLPLSTFTNNRDTLTASVSRATSGAYRSLEQDAQGVFQQAHIQLQGSGDSTSSALASPNRRFSLPGRFGADIAVDQAATQLAVVLVGIREGAAHVDGMNALNALLLLVRSQAHLPGRKTILLLSEGLPIPPDNGEMMRALISEANRANVSFYSIDVHGLTVNSAGSEASNLFQGVPGPGLESGPSLENVDGQNTSAVGLNDLGMALHTNRQASLRELAESTGGFLIADTNDIQTSMRRVMEDVRTHYELVYTPTSTDYSGRFRHIEIKLARPNLVVHSRTGYYALPNLEGKPLLPFEYAGLNVLSQIPPPKAVGFQVGVMRYRPEAAGSQYQITFEIPTSGITIKEDAKRRAGRVHVSLLGLVKDDHQQVVAKVSRDIANDYPFERLAAVRTGNIIVSQGVELPQGHYTLECAVLDREGDRAGVKRIAVVAMEQKELSLSNLVLVRRVEASTDSLDTENPFQFAGGRITPTLNSEVRADAPFGLYFVIYPNSGEAQPHARLQIVRDGKLFRESPLQLPTAEGGGAFPVLTTAALPPGQYLIRAVIDQGMLSTAAEISVTVK
jgi:VWFA-related protein